MNQHGPCLAPKQCLTLYLAAQGKTEAQIALARGISLYTVRETLRDVRQKLHVQTTVEAVCVATRAGWFDALD